MEHTLECNDRFGGVGLCRPETITGQSKITSTMDLPAVRPERLLDINVMRGVAVIEARRGAA